MSERPPKVFLSYSHDSREHAARVLQLSNRLRADGVETRLDQDVKGGPDVGWLKWTEAQLDWAEFVLIVCTETYHRRFQKEEEPGEAYAVAWGVEIVVQQFHDLRAQSPKRFVPVIFDRDHEKHIPSPLRGSFVYVLDSEDNYRDLLRFLRREFEGEVASAPLQKLPVLPDAEVATLLARLAYESPSDLALAESPTLEALEAALQRRKRSAAELAVVADELAKASPDFLPDPLWLAWVQVTHRRFFTDIPAWQQRATNTAARKKTPFPREGASWTANEAGEFVRDQPGTEGHAPTA